MEFPSPQMTRMQELKRNLSLFRWPHPVQHVLKNSIRCYFPADRNGVSPGIHPTNWILCIVQNLHQYVHTYVTVSHMKIIKERGVTKETPTGQQRNNSCDPEILEGGGGAVTHIITSIMKENESWSCSVRFQDLACDWSEHNEHSGHILGVRGFRAILFTELTRRGWLGHTYFLILFFQAGT